MVIFRKRKQNFLKIEKHMKVLFENYNQVPDWLIKESMCINMYICIYVHGQLYTPYICTYTYLYLHILHTYM